MTDQDCVHFLQWALPRLHLRWRGFKKVRKQVCKRIKRRMHLLEIPDWQGYRQYLEANPGEWKLLDGMCRITISRFYRDHYIFDYIGESVFPRLVEAFPDVSQFRCISLGCASGEEPYTIAILWKEQLRSRFPDVSIQIIGLDTDEVLLQRARKGIFKTSSLRELPEDWRRNAFINEKETFTLKDEYKVMVEFVQADIRDYDFSGPYHLVCCKNLLATYFSEYLQIETFQRIRKAMPTGAGLVVGTHEMLPSGVRGFKQDDKVKQIYWAV